MVDKRTLQRKFLKLYLEVSDRETDKLFGHLVDVTDIGGQLTSEQPIKTGETFQLKLTLPAEIMGTKELDFSATTIWSEKDSESDFYNTGFQFGALSAQNAEIVKILIEKYCF